MEVDEFLVDTVDGKIGAVVLLGVGLAEAIGEAAEKGKHR